MPVCAVAEWVVPIVEGPTKKSSVHINSATNEQRTGLITCKYFKLQELQLKGLDAAKMYQPVCTAELAVRAHRMAEHPPQQLHTCAMCRVWCTRCL